MQAAILKFMAGARFPTLLKVAAALFVVDMVTPDPLPLLDEAFLGLVTLALGKWKASRDEPTSN